MARPVVPLLAVGASLLTLAAVFTETGPGAAGSQDAEGVEFHIAKPAAAFDFTALDGTRFVSTEMLGGIVVLDVWATWCGPCMTEIPMYGELRAEYVDAGVEVIGVAVQSGSELDVRHWIEKQFGSFGYPVAMGTEAFEAGYGPLWALPTTLLIDQHGQIRRTWIGAVPTKHFELRVLIDRLLETAATE